MASSREYSFDSIVRILKRSAMASTIYFLLTLVATAVGYYFYVQFNDVKDTIKKSNMEIVEIINQNKDEINKNTNKFGKKIDEGFEQVNGNVNKIRTEANDFTDRAANIITDKVTKYFSDNEEFRKLFSDNFVEELRTLFSDNFVDDDFVAALAASIINNDEFIKKIATEINSLQAQETKSLEDDK